MIKRFTWFVSGAVAGVAGVGIAKRKIKQAATHLTPRNVVNEITTRVRESVVEGRVAMRAKETELRARLDGRVVRLADDLDDGDEVLVDGVPVEPGQVIVLKQIRDRDADRRRFRA
jgi:hypothetical protein